MTISAVCTTSELWLCGLSRGSLSIFGSVGVVPLIRIGKGVIIDSPRKEIETELVLVLPLSPTLRAPGATTKANRRSSDSSEKVERS